MNQVSDHHEQNMANDITRELLTTYFSDDCNPDENNEVEKWMAANEANMELAKQWLLETNNERGKLYLNLLAGRQKIWQKILKHIIAYS